MVSIDPLGRYCSCGHVWHFHKWDYILMLIFNRKVIRCPQCGRKHEYKLVYHCIEKFDGTRASNKDLAEGKKIIWKKG